MGRPSTIAVPSYPGEPIEELHLKVPRWFATAIKTESIEQKLTVADLVVQAFVTRMARPYIVPEVPPDDA